MHSINVRAQIEFLQETGGDTWNIEAKKAADGYPESLDETLSAFANMPEGGLILLGISEGPGVIDVTGVGDAGALMDALGAKARGRINPPIRLGAVEKHVIDGKDVVACVVPPQAPELRPYRVGENGPAYIRSGDGDHQLSEHEVRIMVAHQMAPRFDVQPVHGADVDRDLDPQLLDQYLSRQRQRAPRLDGLDRKTLLVRTNVVDPESGSPTVAAVYAMGIHPQQFLPTLSVKARVIPGEGSESQFRLRNQREGAGPIPDLLESTVDWLAENSGVSVVFDPESGHGRDIHDLPLVALREIVANALVHRDLSAASQNSYINVVKKPGKLFVTNPGGLWGLTVRQLGRTGPSARNPVLYEMCRSITTSDGNRVIEASATGIPSIRSELERTHLPEPRFRDKVVSFEVELSSVSLFSAEELEWLQSVPGLSQLSVGQRVALVALRKGEKITNASFRAEFPTMDSVEARRQLQELVQFGLARARGERGGTVYVYRDASSSTGIDQPDLPKSGGTGRVPARERRRRVVDTLTGASEPLSKEELKEATTLRDGQINPILQDLRKQGVVEFTEPARSPNQRYRLVDQSTDDAD